MIRRLFSRRYTQILETTGLLWKVLKKSRRRQLLVLVPLSILCAGGEVGNIGALLPFLKLLSNPSQGLAFLGDWANPLRQLAREQQLLLLGLGFILFLLLSTSLRVLTIVTQSRLMALVHADFSKRVFANILQRPYVWHISNNSSHTLSILWQDVGAVSDILNTLISTGVNALIGLMLIIALLAVSPLAMTTIALLLAFFYLIVYRFTSGTLLNDGRAIYENSQLALQAAQESLGGIRDTILDHSQPFFLNSFTKPNIGYHLANSRVTIKSQVPRYLIEGFCMILIVGLSLVFALGGQGVDKQLPLLGTFALGAYRLLQPLQQCFNSISGLKVNQVAWRRVKPYLNEPIHQHPENARLQSVRPNSPETSNNFVQKGIRLEKVGFRYQSEGSWIIKNLDLTIKPGSRIALVGSTGSGKSTTIDIILGLLKPVAGQVLIDGYDLHETPNLLKSWQKRIGHVPQHIYLCDGSFETNIAFGVDPSNIDINRVRQAAKKAHLDEFIRTQPNGYSTVIGERGICLSGGQRQRLGIARALYKQGDILVLDEATSALDNNTELNVMDAIESLDRSLTIIMIAHRLTTIKSCDIIHIMEAGKVKESGSYKELISSSRYFKTLAGEGTSGLGSKT